MSKNSSGRRGMHPVIAFILGFLLALIIIAGAVGGGIYFALNYKLDKIEANKGEDDEDGKPTYIYVNADPDNGGAENLLDLFTKLTELTSDEKLSLGKIEALFPIAGGVADKLDEALSEYVDIKPEEMKKVPLTELGAYFQDRVMEIRPADLVKSIGGGELTGHEIVNIILEGKEADYVIDGENYYPVFFDVYDLTENGFVRRTDDGLSEYRTTLDKEKEHLLSQRDDGYRLYYFHYRNTNFITERGDDGKFIFMTDYGYPECVETVSRLTGCFYIDENGKTVEISPVTIGSFADGTAFDSLYEVLVTDILKSEGEDNELTDKILGSLTLGELVDGKADFEEIINGLEIADFVDIDPSNRVLTYMGYGVTDLIKTSDGSYTGRYKLEDGTSVKCFITTALKEDKTVVEEVYYYGENGEKILIGSTQVRYISERLEHVNEELALSDLVSISAPDGENNNAIMIFLAYSVTDITPAAEGMPYSYEGICHTDDGDIGCFIRTEGATISEVYYIDENGEEVPVKKTKIAQVSPQISKLQDTLKLKEIIHIPEDNKILAAVADSTINGLSDCIDSITVNDLYAENIYGMLSPDAEGEVIEGTADIYLAVKGTPTLASEYGMNLIYYVFDNGEYRLASTTGKLTQEEYSNGTYYTFGEGKILFDEAFIYYVYDGGSYSIVNAEAENMGKLLSGEFEENTYYTYGSPNAMWKLLVYVSDGADGKTEKAYTVNNLTSMIKNVTANTKSSTMYELNEAGIITMEETDLNKTISYKGKDKVGELTLEELLTFFISLVNGIPEVPAP